MEGGGGRDEPSACRAGDVNMDDPKKEDILLLADEKFDFDLSLSSSSANEDDEVFFGPVGHKERCIAASLELNNAVPEQPPLPASESPFAWSPLAGEKFVEVYKEAHLLALQIESSSRNQAAQAAKPEDPRSQGVERFIQESKLKINLFEKEKEMKKSPTSLKRETYYLSDSPLLGPPVGEPRLLASSPALPSSGAQASLARAPGPPHSAHALPGESCTAHAPSQAATQRKPGTKLLLPRAASVRGRSIPGAAEKVSATAERLPGEPPLLAPQPSHRSHMGKAPEVLGLKKTLLKAPGSTSNLARKSSSGPVWSGASSACTSPAAGKAKSSEFASIPANSSRPLSNISKSGRMGPAMLRSALPAGPVGASSWQAKRVDVSELAAEQLTAPASASPTQPQTPEGGGQWLNSSCTWSESSQLNKTRSIRRQDSYLNSKTKVMPTPTNQFKIPKFSIGDSPDSSTPKLSRAQRPQSCTSVGRVTVHSTPVRRSSGPAPQSLLSAQRVSALPTPASRRFSGLPPMTPKTMPRAVGSPLCVPARRRSSEPRKNSAMRTEPTRESNRKTDSRLVDVSPDRGSPPSRVPQALNFSPEESDSTFSKSTATEVAREEAKPGGDAAPSEALLVDIKLDPLAVTPDAASQPLIDLPLIDFCDTPEAHVAVGSESRPLIDLMTNTPDMNKNVAKPSPVVGQLIDLSSPLIQLSPEADKENVDSPLLKF
uniref:G2 and S-phase expressed 1 n=1 Tax=Gorilla gorilla gorilla TaxID=9595 RepID=A0A2I2YHJ4_GORGO